MDRISHTDLILNPDGSIYHLALLPEEIADTLILVGDPGRVKLISSRFDQVEVQRSNREFVTHTGSYRGKRISVLSTGIGTDNIDIVLNELDALVNVDLKERKVKDQKQSLTFIRIGTSGALHSHIEPGSRIITEIAGGLDGLYHFYEDREQYNISELSEAFMAHTNWKRELAHPYFVKGSEQLISRFNTTGHLSGLTLSTPGFYAPQIRSIRLHPFDKQLIDKLTSFRYGPLKVHNFEMESSALYALAALLGHEALTICLAVANRVTEEFLEDYKPAMESLIEMVLDKIAGND